MQRIPAAKTVRIPQGPLGPLGVPSAPPEGMPHVGPVGATGPLSPGTGAEMKHEAGPLPGMDVIHQIDHHTLAVWRIRKHILDNRDKYAPKDAQRALNGISGYLDRLRRARAQQMRYVHAAAGANASDEGMDVVRPLAGFFAHTLPTALGFRNLGYYSPYGEQGIPGAAKNQSDAALSLVNDFTGYKQIKNIVNDPLGGGLALASIIPFLKPLRLAGAIEEGARVGMTSEESKLASGLDAAKGAYAGNRGVVRPLLQSAREFLPSERALRASGARDELFGLIDDRLPPARALEVKNTWDRAIRTMVKNGQASSVEDAVSHLYGATGEGPLGQFLTQMGHESIPHISHDTEFWTEGVRIKDPETGRTVAKLGPDGKWNVWADANSPKATSVGITGETALQKLGVTSDSDMGQSVMDAERIMHGHMQRLGLIDPALYQVGDEGMKGWFQIVEHPDGRVQDGLAARIGLTKSADATTAIHELGHFLGHFGIPAKAQGVIESWVGKPFAEWGVDEHEQFARGLESYVRSGAAPNTLKAEFEKLSPVFHDAYPRINDLPALPKEVEGVYKHLLGHKDGLPAAVYFSVRNKAVASTIARAHGPARSPDEAHAHLVEVNEKLRLKGDSIRDSEVSRIAPGEKPEEHAGELGHRVRAHIAGRPDLEGLGTYEAVGAKNDLPAQSVARKKQLEGYSVERGKRIASASDAYKAAGGGQAGHYASKAKLAGELPKETTSKLDLTQDEIDHLHDFIESYPSISGRGFARVSARDALEKLVRGETLQANEERLLGHIFGKMDYPRNADSALKSALKGSFRAEWRKKTWGQRVIEVTGVSRALQSMIDFSALLRQGLVAAVHNPRVWGRQIKPMLEGVRSEATYEEYQAAISENPYHAIMTSGKDADRISFAAPGEKLADREENFPSQLAEAIPLGVGWLVKKSDHAYTGFLNLLRSGQAESLYMKAAMAGWDLGEEEVRGSINRFINSSTGRGSLGGFQGAANVLNQLMFSPRLLFSRLNFLNPIWYASLQPFARREAWRAMLHLIVFAGGIAELAKLGGARVSTDSTNADFLKIRIGNTRIDLLGGFQQPIRLAGQLIHQRITSSTTGLSVPLSGKFAGTTSLDILWRFFQSKMAPTPAAGVEVLQQQDPTTHQPLDWSSFSAYRSVILNHIEPLIAQDIASVVQAHRPYLLPLPILGIGVQDYGPSKSSATKAQESWITDTEKILGHKIPAGILAIRAAKTEYQDMEKKAANGSALDDTTRAGLLLKVFVEKNPKYASYEPKIQAAISSDPSTAVRELEGLLGWNTLESFDSEVNQLKRQQEATSGG